MKADIVIVVESGQVDKVYMNETYHTAVVVDMDAIRRGGTPDQAEVELIEQIPSRIFKILRSEGIEL